MILDYVNHITEECLNEQDVKDFNKRVNLFGSIYPIEYIDSLNDLQDKIKLFLQNRKIPQCVFMTERRLCFKCGNALEKNNKFAVNAVLFSAFSGPIGCLNFYILCMKCDTKHYILYCVLPDERRFFYDDVLESVYVSFTKLTVYGKRLFDVLSADIHFKHSSYQSFSQSYNSVFPSNSFTQRKLNDLRLAVTWLYYHVLKFMKEFHMLSQFNAPIIEDLDKMLCNIRLLCSIIL